MHIYKLNWWSICCSNKKQNFIFKVKTTLILYNQHFLAWIFLFSRINKQILGTLRGKKSQYKQEIQVYEAIQEGK